MSDGMTDKYRLQKRMEARDQAIKEARDMENASKQYPNGTIDIWELQKDFRWEAAHQLPEHSGKCRRLHGHSFLCTITVRGEYLVRDGSAVGMLMDYSDIKKHMKPLVENYLDHYNLNETTGLFNPTSELLARWVYKKLEESGLERLESVTIHETCTCRCTYRRTEQRRETK